MIVPKDELMHYGVKGMKWGVRRAAKNTYKQTVRDARRGLGAAYDRADKNYSKHKNFEKYNNENVRAINKYKSTKEQAKSDYKQTLSTAKAEKKEFKQDVKTATKIAKKNPTSNDVITYADSLQAKKGKEYAESVLKTSRNRLYGQTIGSVAVGTASIAGSLYLSYKLGSM